MSRLLETPLIDALRERRLLKLWRRLRAEGGIIGIIEKMIAQAEQQRKDKQKKLIKRKQETNLPYVV